MANFIDLNMAQTSIGQFDFYSVLTLAQKQLSEKNSDLFTDDENETENAMAVRKEKIKNAISKFVFDKNFKVIGVRDNFDLINRIYDEMVNFSVLTPYIEDKNNEYEEININAWNDVEVRCCNGDVKKVEHFCNIEHARNVVKRLVTVAGTQIDNAMPMAEGNLRNNVRLVVLESPIVDEDVGVAASIRLLKPQFASREFFINNGTVSTEEMNFLELAIRSGVSMVFVGETGSGKTTLMNYLLSTIPNERRVVSIEHNARELSLVKKDANGNIINNVVHMKTRPHQSEELNISQEDLVSKALRLDPNNICVGEMRDTEAYAAQEASLTGHTVVTSIHARGVSATHFRIAMLAIKKYPIDIKIALMQAAMAFPVVVYLSKLDDNSRRVMEISECQLLEDNNDMYRIYSTLYEYNITNTAKVDGNIVITGAHVKRDKISDEIRKTMMLHGATVREIESL